MSSVPTSENSHPVRESDASVSSGTRTEAAREPEGNERESRETGRVTSPSGQMVVVGGGQLGRLVARQLDARATNAMQGVHYVDDNEPAVARAAQRHDATLVTNLASRDALEPVVDGAVAVVVAAQNDATTLLVVGHLRASFEVPHVVAVVRDPRNRDAYPPDVECVCATTLVAEAVAEMLC